MQPLRTDGPRRVWTSRSSGPRAVCEGPHTLHGAALEGGPDKDVELNFSLEKILMKKVKIEVGPSRPSRLQPSQQPLSRPSRLQPSRPPPKTKSVFQNQRSA